MADDLKKIKQEIEALQAKAEALVETEKASVIEDMQYKIEAYGITARELGYGGGSGPRTTGRVPVKYKKGPHSWSGRGRKPKWVEDHLTKGGKIEDLLIK